MNLHHYQNQNEYIITVAFRWNFDYAREIKKNINQILLNN